MEGRGSVTQDTDGVLNACVLLSITLGAHSLARSLACSDVTVCLHGAGRANSW